MKEIDKPSNVARWNRGIAYASRTFVMLLLLWIIVHNFWPTAIWTTPLARLTLGAIFGALFGVAFSIASIVVIGKMVFSPPPLSERDGLWCELWLMTGMLMLVIPLVPFLILLAPSNRQIATWQPLAATLLGWVESLIF